MTETAMVVPDPYVPVRKRLLHIQKTLGKVEKTGRVNFAKVDYKYVKAETWFALMQQRLADANISVTPHIHEVTFSPNGALMVGRMTIVYEDANDPSDRIEQEWYASASSDDKGTNKIGTSGLKYATMRKLFATDELDPDAEAEYEDGKPVGRQAKKQEQVKAKVEGDVKTVAADIRKITELELPDVNAWANLFGKYKMKRPARLNDVTVASLVQLREKIIQAQAEATPVEVEEDDGESI